MLNNYVQSLLGENERILLTSRQHWFVLVSAIRVPYARMIKYSHAVIFGKTA